MEKAHLQLLVHLLLADLLLAHFLLAHLQLLPPHYQFYNQKYDFYKRKSENRFRYVIERPTYNCWYTCC